MPASVAIFKKYMNPVFIETGSFKGHGIQHALDAGFSQIYSMEILPRYYHYCSVRFEEDANIYIMHGDSTNILTNLLPRIDKRITFWLDAHLSSLPNVSSCPLLQELEIIRNHHIKNHTILIDDLRDWNIPTYGFNVETLKERILLINKDYKFLLEDGHVPNDILVGYVDSTS